MAEGNRPPVISDMSPGGGVVLIDTTPTLSFLVTDPDRTDGLNDYPTRAIIRMYKKVAGSWRFLNSQVFTLSDPGAGTDPVLVSVTWGTPLVVDNVPTSAWEVFDIWGVQASNLSNLDNPGQIARDSNGNYFVADYANNKLVKYDTTGRVVIHRTVTGPLGVAVDETGAVYVTTTTGGGNGGIIKVTNDLLTQTWTTGSLTAVVPLALAIDGTYVYFTETALDRVYRILRSTGASLTSLVVSGPNSDEPLGIATDGTHFWMVDTGANLVRKFTVAGAAVSTFAIPAGSRHITRKSDGTFLIANRTTSMIYHYTEPGVLLESIPVPTPESVVPGDNGALVVTNALGDAIYFMRKHVTIPPTSFAWVVEVSDETGGDTGIGFGGLNFELDRPDGTTEFLLTLGGIGT
jgi:sugar lactone lactonase YvrE